MISLPSNLQLGSVVGRVVAILLPLLLLGTLIALCVQLPAPFLGLLPWTIILAVCFYPVHRWLTARGMSNRLSATVIGTALAALILVPTAIASISAASSIPRLVSGLQSGEQKVPLPPDGLQRVPFVGPKLHHAWAQASTDMPTFAKHFGPQLTSVTKWLLGAAGGMFAAVLALLLAVIFAAITLAYSDAARAFAATIFARVTGDRIRGDHYLSIVGATVRSVANGVIGVAFVQALLCGIGFFAVGIPGAGILSILAMVLGVLQVPVLIVTLPAIIYAFAVKSTTVAILFA